MKSLTWPLFRERLDGEEWGRSMTLKYYIHNYFFFLLRFIHLADISKNVVKKPILIHIILRLLNSDF